MQRQRTAMEMEQEQAGPRPFRSKWLPMWPGPGQASLQHDHAAQRPHRISDRVDHLYRIARPYDIRTRITGKLKAVTCKPVMQFVVYLRLHTGPKYGNHRPKLVKCGRRGSLARCLTFYRPANR